MGPPPTRRTPSGDRLPSTLLPVPVSSDLSLIVESQKGSVSGELT